MHLDQCQVVTDEGHSQLDFQILMPVGQLITGSMLGYVISTHSALEVKGRLGARFD
jgi:hypothetical protein